MRIHRSRLPALLTIALCLQAATGCVVIPVGDLLRGPPLKEQVLVEGAGWFWKDKVAVIEVEGVIQGSGSSSLFFPRENTVSEVLARLELARADSQVRALVVRISSPGGEVTACDVLHAEIRKFRQETGIPIVTCITDVGASGGYYLAVTGDSIYAQPTAMVGSIGVLLQSWDLSGLLHMVGVSFAPVKSGEMKDINSPFRTSTEEERKVLQALVDDMHSRFVDVVAAGRPRLPRSEIEKLADGRVVSAEDAVALQLVDKVGYLRDAVSEAARLAKIERPTIVRYGRVPRSGNGIYTAAPEDPASAGTGFHLRLDGRLPEGPRLYYLWNPGL